MSTLILPTIHSYRFRFSVMADIRLAEYTGSAWRGLLGHGLKRVSCLVRAKTCDGCLLLHKCPYAQVFETKQPDAANPRFQAKPHPFVLTLHQGAEMNLRQGDSVDLSITLIGAANAYLPYLIQGMVEAGKLGMGKARVPFKLQAVCQRLVQSDSQWQTIYSADTSGVQKLPWQQPKIPPAPHSTILEICTPLRIKREGKLIGSREFVAADFLRQLWRRLNDLAQFHADESGWQVALPSSKAQEVRKATSQLRWLDWTRYSSRQQSSMQMGGLVGELHIEDELLADWWPLIWAGQWLHLGKATSMGLGEYRIKPAQACEACHTPMQEAYSAA